MNNIHIVFIRPAHWNHRLPRNAVKGLLDDLLTYNNDEQQQCPGDDRMMMVYIL